MRFHPQDIDPKAAPASGDASQPSRPQPFTIEPKAIAFYGSGGEIITTKVPPADYVRDVIRHRFGDTPTPADILRGYECIGEDSASRILGAVRFAIVDCAPDSDTSPLPCDLSLMGGHDDD